jgi:hypothetical protein
MLRLEFTHSAKQICRVVEYIASTGIIAAGLYLAVRSIQHTGPSVDLIMDLGIAATGIYFTKDAMRPRKIPPTIRPPANKLQ